MLFGRKRKRCRRNADFYEIGVTGFMPYVIFVLYKLPGGDVCAGSVSSE